ncbi:hypothetical protein BH11MYX4_BH11MYX4_31900 [soil metagenome]
MTSNFNLRCLIRAAQRYQEAVMTTRAIPILALLVLTTCSAACTPVRPWERGKLAHPTMASSTFAGPAEEHANSVREGATGGGAAGESGCGCN